MRDGSQLSIVNEIKLAIAAVALLIAAGTAGYVFIEGWAFLDAFYMTVITVFTVGFREVFPLSPAGQVFTAVLIMFGVGVALWAGTSMLQLALSPDARVLMRRRRMRREISKLRDHYIICGYGRIGREVCACLMRRNVPHAIGDQDEARLEELENLGCPFVMGDCSSPRRARTRITPSSC
jgi:voltage-gated potassium channel